MPLGNTRSTSSEAMLVKSKQVIFYVFQRLVLSNTFHQFNNGRGKTDRPVVISDSAVTFLKYS